MSILTDVGNLMYLYLDEIQLEQPIEAPEFLIQATAKLLETCGGRNWVPVIVREIGKDQYEVIGNFFVYAVAESAGLERIWCIVADSSDVAADLSRALAREGIPKINLSIASRDEIIAALRYLIDQPNSALKSINLSTAANRIEEAPRQYWKSLRRDRRSQVRNYQRQKARYSQVSILPNTATCACHGARCHIISKTLRH